MNVLLIGSGGREHAIAWKLSQSKKLDNLFILTGNSGTKDHGSNISLKKTDFPTIARKCIQYEIEMIVVGPEVFLVEGIKNFFRKKSALNHIKVVGPDKAAAKLEGSKSFAKDFMKNYNIPTAAYLKVNTENISEGLDFIENQSPPFVLKADGLAGGKGVIICEDKEEAKNKLKEMLNGKFGNASKTVVIEEFIKGVEISAFILTDGDSYKILPFAKDYKRIGENDTGLNTGGMGAISPVPFNDDSLKEKIEKRIIKPTLKGIKEHGFNYHGFLFFGLMISEGNPYLIEYNVRLGDPEAEVILPRINSDLFYHLESLFEGSLKKQEIKTDKKCCTSVMLTSGGYPEEYEKGKKITGIEKVTKSIVFHAGSNYQNGEYHTTGGRVMAVTSLANTIEEALEKSYQSAEIIKFDKKYYRKDIGFDLINK